MNNTNASFCSIIVLNYYGEYVIADTLNSLLDLDYPKDRYEIIVVDNDSKDKSKQILLKYGQKFKNIKTLFLKKNLGFSKGNNIGIRQAKGEYICLLNNDCFVESKWLKELVETVGQDKNIFAVSPKALLYPGYIYPRIKIIDNFVVKDASLKHSHLLKYTQNKEIPLERIWSDNPNDRIFTIEIPFDQKFDDVITCQIDLLTTGKINKKNLPLKLINHYNNIIEISYFKHKDLYSAKLKIHLSQIPEDNKYHKIQNAGIMIFQEGSGRDIGAIVRYHKQYYELDKGQFDNKREIYAACAAASLYRKDVLEKIGYLDETFFMYYEDVEISERARLQGYKIFYNPKSLVRHLHALSSKEWSSFFIYNVEKGRYLHLLYYFPYSAYLFVLGFIRLFINGIGRLMVSSSKRKNHLYNLQYLMLVGYFVINFLKLIYFAIKKRSLVPKEKLIKNLNIIMSGRWYFERQ